MMREDRSWAEKQTFKRKGIKVKVSPRKGQWETGIIKGEKCLCYRYAPPFRGENTRSEGNNGPRWGPSVFKKKKNGFSCILYNSENSSNRKLGILKKSL